MLHWPAVQWRQAEKRLKRETASTFLISLLTNVERLRYKPITVKGTLGLYKGTPASSPTSLNLLSSKGHL